MTGVVEAHIVWQMRMLEKVPRLICWYGTESVCGGVSGGAFGGQRSSNSGVGAADGAASARGAFGGQHIAVSERMAGRPRQRAQLSQVRRLQRNEICANENVCGRWEQ